MTVNSIKSEQSLIHSKLRNEKSIDKAISIVDNSIKKIASKKIKDKKEIDALQAYRNEIKAQINTIQSKNLTKNQKVKFNKTVDAVNKHVNLKLQKSAKNSVSKNEQGSLSAIKKSLSSYNFSHYSKSNKKIEKDWEKTVLKVNSTAVAKKPLFGMAKGEFTGELLGLNKDVVQKHCAVQLPPTSDNRLHIYADVIKKHFKTWTNEKNSNGIPHYLTMSFDAYMAKNQFPKMKIADKANLVKNSVHYLDQAQRKQFLVSYANSELRLQGQSLADGDYIYVLGKDKNLYAGLKQKGTFHHSSFLSGVPVKSVGMFSVKNKKIVTVNAHSGHYKPSMESTKIIKKYLSSNKRLGKAAKAIARVKG